MWSLRVKIDFVAHNQSIFNLSCLLNLMHQLKFPKADAEILQLSYCQDMAWGIFLSGGMKNAGNLPVNLLHIIFFLSLHVCKLLLLAFFLNLTLGTGTPVWIKKYHVFICSTCSTCILPFSEDVQFQSNVFVPYWIFVLF